MSRKHPTFALIVLLLFTSACYTFRVEASGSKSATEPQKVTVWCLFWQEARITPSNCPTNNLHKVVVKTNIGYLLLTVATLGVVHPMEIEWTCAPDPVLVPGTDPLGLKQPGKPSAPRQPEKLSLPQQGKHPPQPQPKT
jgi:hypothetical protein